MNPTQRFGAAIVLLAISGAATVALHGLMNVDIHQFDMQRAQAEEAQYRMAEGRDDRCVAASQTATLYLIAEDKAEYHKWKAIKTRECGY